MKCVSKQGAEGNISTKNGGNDSRTQKVYDDEMYDLK